MGVDESVFAEPVDTSDGRIQKIVVLTVPSGPVDGDGGDEQLFCASSDAFAAAS